MRTQYTYKQTQAIREAVKKWKRLNGNAPKNWEKIRSYSEHIKDFTTKQICQKWNNDLKKIDRPNERTQQQRHPRTGGTNAAPADQIRVDAAPNAAGVRRGFHKDSPDVEKLEFILQAAQLVEPFTVTHSDFWVFVEEQVGNSDRLIRKWIPWLVKNRQKADQGWFERALIPHTLGFDDSETRKEDLKLLRQRFRRDSNGNLLEEATNSSSRDAEMQSAGPSRNLLAGTTSTSTSRSANQSSATNVLRSNVTSTTLQAGGQSLPQREIEQLLEMEDEASVSGNTAKDFAEASVTSTANASESESEIYKKKPLHFPQKYNEAIVRPHCSYMEPTFEIPIPRGYDASHTERLLADNEWRRLLAERNFNFVTDDFGKLIQKNEIVVKRDPNLVRLDFFKYAVPRANELLEFRKMTARDIRLSLENFDRYAAIAIYHSLDYVSVAGLEVTIDAMVSKSYLSTSENSVDQWMSLFVNSVFHNNADFFHTTDKGEFLKIKFEFLKDWEMD